MFGDVAVTLLKMMGHSGAVPGALPAAGIPAAIARLQQALVADGAHEQNKPGLGSAATVPDAAPIPVGLSLRTYPLIQLLFVAAMQDCDVMWDLGEPRI